jgi:putative ABC transport system substrate-binding protein
MFEESMRLTANRNLMHFDLLKVDSPIKVVALFIIFYLFFCQGSSFAGHKIVVVQSSRIKPYEEALNGFNKACPSSVKRLIVSELNNEDIVKKIYGISPDMVLTIGMDALSSVKSIKDIPVVYLMVLNPQSIVSGQENITGVSISIPPEKQLLSLSMALPEMKTIGLVYDPVKTSHMVKRAQDAASRLGLKLVAREISSPRDFPSALMGMKSKIDVFWMLPDTTAVTPETVKFLFLFSMEQKIPVISFSKKYVETGALMSIGIDPYDIGTQAGEMANKIFAGRNVKNVKQADARDMALSVNKEIARKMVLSVNEKIARNLGIQLNESVISKSRLVN